MTSNQFVVSGSVAYREDDLLSVQCFNVWSDLDNKPVRKCVIIYKVLDTVKQDEFVCGSSGPTRMAHNNAIIKAAMKYVQNLDSTQTTTSAVKNERQASQN